MASSRREGRLPQPRLQYSDAPPLKTSASLDSGASFAHSRSQIARPVMPASGTKTSSTPAERNRQTPPRPELSSGYVHQSLLPRPGGQSLPATPYPPSTGSSNTARTMQPPSTGTMVNSTESRNDVRMPVTRPRNVLRRKAATIGQHKENSRPKEEMPSSEKLSVVIPGPTPSHMLHTTSPSLVQRSVKPPHHEHAATRTGDQLPNHGPKELASLRTTVNTKNLTPPTPSFPTASSSSTRYSGSPGMWSRTSTPTSLSSCSPGFVSVKVGARSKQQGASRTRLPTFSPPVQQSPSHETGRNEFMSPNLTGYPDFGQHKSAERPQGPKPEGISPLRVLDRKPSTSSGPPAATAGETMLNIPSHLTRTVSADNAIDSIPAPSRPSREGTHQLNLEPSPVIQSNLSPQSVTKHKRRDSAGSVSTVEKPHPTPSQSAATSVDSLQSKCSTWTASSSASPTMSRKSPRTLTKAPKEKPEAASSGRRKSLGLFTRPSRNDLDTSNSNQTKPTRKGPAAGTGHEGYGKYGQPSRRTSVSSNGSRKAPSAGGTRKGRPNQGIDEFLLNRLEPVVINGGGMDGAVLTRTLSDQSISGLSQASSSLTGHSVASEPITCSTDSESASSATIGTRSPGFASTGRDTPLRQQARRASPDGRSTSRSRMPVAKQSSNNSAASLSGNSNVTALSHSFHEQDTPSNLRRKQSQRGKGLRWNFFQRSRNSEKKQLAKANSSTPQLSATISPAQSRPVAHYALVNVDSDSLADIFHKIEDSPPTDDGEIRATVTEQESSKAWRQTHRSTLLRPPPHMQAEFPKDDAPSTVFFSTSPAHGRAESKRQSRLESVGRIPRVVSRRDREHKPALESFSRPFSVTESPSLVASASGQDETAEQLDESSKLGHDFAQPPVELSSKPRLGYDVTQPFGDLTQRSPLDFIAGPYSGKEFLRLSHRKGSSNSTCDSGSWAPTGQADTPDDIWGEYDDLIDCFSPETSNDAVLGKPNSDERFESATMASQVLHAGLNVNTGKRESETLAGTVASDRSSSRYTDDNIRLRRSKAMSTLNSPLPPSSQPSYTDIIAAYDDMGTDSADLPMEPTAMAANEPHSNLASPAIATPQDFETSRHRNTILFDIAERDREGPTMQTNLRSGSLMTSRWLSFGRVLFSPAHNHIKTGEAERILVIDGLGNDDWSFYCSLTYPTAEVYNLSTTAPSSTPSTNPAAWHPPSNHHTIHHRNLASPFPFPKGFFAVAVLRFPSASSDAEQDNTVSECKRVLRAGGYLEMSVLDLDMVNMGSRTRKAVRKLKERTYAADPSISLKPASDSFQRLLGRHGFDGLRRCMVSIPVAGMVARSSSDSSSSTASLSKQRLPPRPSPPDETGGGGESLGDLLSNPLPSSSNDENIRKIVTRVARWWYTRCYELPVLPDGNGDASIWVSDGRRVLRECQKWGTGFQLLVGYAMKPGERRRTVSV